MNTSEDANNKRLRELVQAAGLSQAVALTIFNRGLGAGAYSESAWKAFFCSHDATGYQALSDELLQHAENVFGKLQKVT